MDEERYTQLLTVSASRIFVHPEFNAANLQNDFALLKLNTDVRFTENVRTICLPDETTCDPMEISRDYARSDGCVTVQTAGWGLTEDGGESLIISFSLF